MFPARAPQLIFVRRYFFFQTMSTVGALLLLVVHGPGKLSMDEQRGQLVLITAHDA